MAGTTIGNFREPLATEYLDSVEETSRSIHLITDNSINHNQSNRNDKIGSGKTYGFKGLPGMGG